MIYHFHSHSQLPQWPSLLTNFHQIFYYLQLICQHLPCSPAPSFPTISQSLPFAYTFLGHAQSHNCKNPHKQIRLSKCTFLFHACALFQNFPHTYLHQSNLSRHKSQIDHYQMNHCKQNQGAGNYLSRASYHLKNPLHKCIHFQATLNDQNHLVYHLTTYHHICNLSSCGREFPFLELANSVVLPHKPKIKDSRIYPRHQQLLYLNNQYSKNRQDKIISLFHVVFHSPIPHYILNRLYQVVWALKRYQMLTQEGFLSQINLLLYLNLQQFYLFSVSWLKGIQFHQESNYLD